MKLFGFRIRSWLFFGIGFLAGSAAGEGPFKRVMEMVDDLRGKAAGTDFGNGQLRPRVGDTANDLREAVSGFNR
jgi:hypothetical protein